MKTSIVFTGILLNLSGTLLMAQNTRVINGLPSRYVAPTCDLKAGHFKVQSGATYLKTGIETGVAENRTRALANGKKVILVRSETSPEDVHGMMVSQGILTARGGLVSHAAVVARGWGIPAVVGAEGFIGTHLVRPGGPGEGYEWPESNHGITIDDLKRYDAMIKYSTFLTFGIFGRPPDYGPVKAVSFVAWNHLICKEEPEALDKILNFLRAGREMNRLHRRAAPAVDRRARDLPRQPGR